MKIPTVSLETWQKLYGSALRFKQHRPWETFYDSELFVLRDHCGLTGYCCIMGSLGQVLALCVYRGGEGLAMYRRIQAGEILQEQDEMMASQNCLMGEFADRAELKKEDLSTIKALGLKFRGSKSYPLFRSYLPGYSPWYLTEDEARFLSLAFEAAVRFVEQFGSRQDEPIEREGGRLPLYHHKEDAAGSRSWAFSWEMPEPLPQASLPASAVPQDLMNEILAAKLAQTDAWEVGMFVLPHAAIRGAERPYLARILAVLHSRSRIILAHDLIPAYEEGHVALRDFILRTMLNQKTVPREIRICDPALEELLKPIVVLLGVSCQLCKTLPALRDVRTAMTGYIG